MHLTFLFGYTGFKVTPPKMDYEILQKDPLFWHNQTNEIYWLMGRLGQLEREREREREMPYFHVFPCYYLLFHVICTFVGYFLYSDLRSKCWRLKLLHWESQSSKICMTCEVYFLKINLPAVSPDTCPFLIERDLQS